MQPLKQHRPAPATPGYTVELRRMRIYAHHGVMPQEQKVGNWFEVSVSLRAPIGQEALEADSLSGAINYAEVAQVIRHTMAQPCKLLETVAWSIISNLRMKFGTVFAIEVTVAKITPPLGEQMESAAVTLSWHNDLG